MLTKLKMDDTNETAGRSTRIRGSVHGRPTTKRKNPAGGGNLSRRERLLIGGTALAVVITAWQVLSSLRIINPVLASSPSGIVKAGVKLAGSGELTTVLGQSAVLFAIGFGISLITGIALGILMGWYRRFDAAIDPFVSIFYAAPRIALVPLITVWTGIGFTSQIVIVWSTAVFPIIINVAVGVRTADSQQMKMARSFGANSAQLLRTVVLPGAVPAVVSGIRQGLALALIGVVIAEYFVGTNGVGGLIVDAGQVLNTDQAFVGVVIFAIAAVILTALLKMLERRVDRWRM